MKQKQQRQIKVNIQKEAAEGIYSNIVFMNLSELSGIHPSSRFNRGRESIIA